MRLFIMRHGVAGEHGDPDYPDDSLRPLTPDGRKKTRRVARGIAALGIEFDAVLTSPLARARQTADLVVAELELLAEQLIETTSLSPGASRQALLDELSRQDAGASVLLVGHEPDLSQLISELIAGDAEDVAVMMRKAALCELELDEVPPTQRGELRALLQPKHLRAIGRGRKRHCRAGDPD
ncbi:MAG: phosphohistidine phosphatase SixA [Phycisphaerae bacterium]